MSSDNRGASAVGASGRATTAPGKWHISDDGRYCVLIEWKGVPTEEWCRYILQTTDGYYAVRSDSVGTERVYKLEIKKYGRRRGSTANCSRVHRARYVGHRSWGCVRILRSQCSRTGARGGSDR
ncbi:MAG: hypothetical protein EOP82_20480 [Variovorax sp.]|nr:MAG: hypothetical protein EOP82_20480 [Variovorax sp.]